MSDFEAYNPVRILFGKDQLGKLSEQIRNYSKGNILLVYGGGSIHKTGLYDRIMEQLDGMTVTEFSGVEANPQYSTLMKGVELAREKQVDFILAVGGGSVIDGVKFMSGAFYFDGEPWDVLTHRDGAAFDKALPFGTILTLPATGSEANSGAVISRSEIHEKRTVGGPQFFPKFSFCDPSVVATLPDRQVANGIIDAYVHVLEQYLTRPTWNKLQERQAEAILQTLREVGPEVLKDKSDYDAAANLMWCATYALNGSLRSGVVYDWVTHMIGHELTAIYGIDHARTLAIVLPRLYENQFEFKQAKLAQYGKRVVGLSGDDESVAREAIAETERFFQSLGTETKVSAYSDDTGKLAQTIRERFEERGWTAMGENAAIHPAEVEEIVKRAI